jgi:hypothetical protein
MKKKVTCFFCKGDASKRDCCDYSVKREYCKDGKLHFVCSYCIASHIRENAHRNGETYQFFVSNTITRSVDSFEVHLHAGLEYEAFHGLLLYLLQFSPLNASRFLTLGKHHIVTVKLPDNPFNPHTGYSLYRVNRVHAYGEKQHFVL